jgi:flagellar hook-basal body complex protein FliE
MALPIGPVNPFSVGQLVENSGATSSATQSSGGGGFGQMLSNSISKLDQTQTNANQQVQDLATGKAQDLSSVVMSVEQASLEVQLASQIRNKAVDAYNDIFRMQI